jgi:DamX protein
MASLSQALAEQKSTLQETETALVARIADVDDDRRLHTKRLQRFWQKQRTEIEARVHRQAWMVGLAMVSFAALILIGAALAYARIDAAQHALRADIAQLRLAHEQLAALATQDQALRDSLSELSTKVATISATLAQLDDQAKPAAERETAANSADQETPPPSEPTTDSPTEPGGAESPATESPVEVSPDLTPAPSAAAATSSAPSPTPVARSTATAAVAEPARPSLDSTSDDLTAAHAASGSASPSTGEPAPDPGTATVDRATQDAEVARTESSATLGTEPAAATTPSTTAAAVAQAPTDTDSTLADPETTTEAGAPPRQVRVSDDTLLVGDQPYALQLFGFSSQAGMLRFARRKDLPPRVYYREERYRDRPWFVLIHSLHAGYRDAAAVQAQLPSDLATLDTWIRELPAETKLSILEISP